MRVLGDQPRERVEAWQSELKAGDCFILIVQEEIVIYARAVSRLENGSLQIVAYSDIIPHGAEDVIEPYMADIPLSQKQFAIAKICGWPCNLEALKYVAHLTLPGSS